MVNNFKSVNNVEYFPRNVPAEYHGLKMRLNRNAAAVEIEMSYFL